MTHEFRPGQLRALIWLLVLVPLLPTGLMVQFMADTIRAEREAAFDRLTAIYQQTLDNAEAGFARQVAEQVKAVQQAQTPPPKVTARSVHIHFRALLDRDVVVRVVDADGRPLTGATVPAKRAVAQKSLKALGYPWTVQVFLLDDETLARGAQEQVRSYAIILLVVLLFVLTIAIVAAWTVSRQIELRDLRTTAVATVAHELRTPLASMRMLLDTILEGRLRDESQSREYIELLARETERLSRLAEEFLTFSRLERGKQALTVEPVKPRVIADQAVEAIRPRLEAPGCVFSLDVPGDLPPILANRDSLSAVLTNLLDNALKYTREEKHISLWARTAGDAVVFAVTDDGIGIDRAHLRRIFRPFHQVDDRLSRSGEGAGLGLAIVAQLVAAQRGKIRVDSRPGKGATFSVRIPRA